MEVIEASKKTFNTSMVTKKENKCKHKDEADDESTEKLEGKDKRYCIKCENYDMHTTSSCWNLCEYCHKPINKEEKLYVLV